MKHIIDDPNNKEKKVDANDGNKPYNGHVAKELLVGDRFDDKDKSGNPITLEIKENYVTTEGFTVVRAVQV